MVTPSQSAAGTSGPAFSPAFLAALLEKRHFRAGEYLRRKGQIYRDMHLVVSGSVEADLGADVSPVPFVLGAGAPIGEIGFLRGTPASANVMALQPVETLVLTDAALDRLGGSAPELAAGLMRWLADTAEDRVSYNLTLVDPGDTGSEHTELSSGSEPEILLCRTPEQLQAAQALRYRVYCEELGRQSPNADPEAGTIADELDGFGYVFIATSGGAPIGTLRANYAADGPLDGLETIYGMTTSRRYPDGCGICTKFIVDRASRGGPAAMMLISQVVQFGLRDGMKECFIDTVPGLIDYYRALGFETAAPQFFHPENGPSLPMRLDLEAHGAAMTGREGLRRMMRAFVKTRRSRGETA